MWRTSKNQLLDKIKTAESNACNIINADIHLKEDFSTGTYEYAPKHINKKETNQTDIKDFPGEKLIEG